MRRRFGFPAFVGLAAWAIFTSSAAIAVEPCGDLDGDGYVAGSGCAIEDDCNDQNSAIHPGATETCNGWNDDCDAELDEGCDRTCPSFGFVRRHIVNDHAANPRLVLAERGYALSCQDSGDAFYLATRLDARGERISPKRSFTLSYPHNLEIVWTGSEIAAGWGHTRSSQPSAPGVRFRRLGAWGNPPAGEVWLENHEAFHSASTWSGSDFAQIWTII